MFNFLAEAAFALTVGVAGLALLLGVGAGWCWFHDRVLHPHVGRTYDEIKRREAAGDPPRGALWG
jgi:hypothetical protein